jgi:hypothetical protein
MVKDDLVTTLVTLRFVVGFLGERDQFGWWQSAFLSTPSRTFLAHAFAKTLPLAQYSGVTAAAARVHDERIGVGSVYHLFRLPEALEQMLFRAMYEPAMSSDAGSQIGTRDMALAYLDGRNGKASIDAIGPTWVGDTAAVQTAEAWIRVSSLYLHGFRSGTAVYPYFADRSL